MDPQKPTSRYKLVITVLVALLLAMSVACVFGLLRVAKMMAASPNANCQSNIKLILLAATVQAADLNTNLLPSDPLTFTNDLFAPKILHCPADAYHPAAGSWAAFSLSNCSYAFVSGVREGTPDRYISCPYHHTVGLADGTLIPGSSDQWGK